MLNSHLEDLYELLDYVVASLSGNTHYECSFQILILNSHFEDFYAIGLASHCV